MTKQKSTKRALLMSALALLMCVSMLIGSTFAWFTDSVTSANNIIKSGNLDVELYYQVEGQTDWTKVTDTTNVFMKDALWEPGHTEVVKLKVVNEGTLALKYQLGVNIASETDSVNVDGEDFLLSDYIKYGIVDGAQTYTRDTAVAAVDATATALKSAYSNNSQLLSKEEAVVTMVVYMPTTVGNEANYAKGEAVPTINLGINLVATQYTYEEDSFNDQYDADASLDFTPVSNINELKIALANKMKNIVLTGNCYTDEVLNVDYDANIDGNGFTVARADGYTGTVFTVKSNSSLTLEDIIVDGGAVWSGEIDSTLRRGTTNTGVTATGNLIAAENNSSIILNDGAILQNNVGAYAVNLGTRIGATLTVNGGEIINNSSEAGAIWGGGNITVNSGKINGNSSTGIAGVIRMVSSCNLTVNGGEINHNKAAGDGGVIWGYGSSTYTFTGGEMAYNESAGTGGAIYTGNSSVINISGDFEMHNNKAANSGAIRLTDKTSLNMTGGKIYDNTQNGESNAFNTWNNSMSITGGSISDNFSYVGGLGLTIGDAEIDGVISYNLSTNHNTAYLAAAFNTFAFTVNEEAANFSNFNFKPASGYAYTEGDEAKLVCLNEGYSTYWDAQTGTFRLKAD